jgi:hypothetical protein
MDAGKLHALKSEIENAAIDAKLRADASTAADMRDAPEWRGRYQQFKKWADMLAEAIGEDL